MCNCRLKMEQPAICQRGLLHPLYIPPLSSLCCINVSVNNVASTFLGPSLRGFNSLFDPFCVWGNDISLSPLKVKNLCKVAQSRRKLLKNKKLFVCKVNKTAASYRMVWTIAYLVRTMHNDYVESLNNFLFDRCFEVSSLRVTSHNIMHLTLSLLL